MSIHPTLRHRKSQAGTLRHKQLYKQQELLCVGFTHMTPAPRVHPSYSHMSIPHCSTFPPCRQLSCLPTACCCRQLQHLCPSPASTKKLGPTVGWICQNWLQLGARQAALRETDGICNSSCIPPPVGPAHLLRWGLIRCPAQGPLSHAAILLALSLSAASALAPSNKHNAAISASFCTTNVS